MQTDIDIEALNGFIDESNDSLRDIESDFIAFENDPTNIEIINKIFRPVHSLKGNSGFFGLTNINKFSHRLENLLDSIRKEELLVTNEIIDTLLAGVDYLKEMLNRAIASPADTELRQDEEAFLARIEQYKPTVTESPGTVQSIIELENLLNEAMEVGIAIHDNTLINGLLSKIEKTNNELQKIITDHKTSAAQGAYSPDTLYFHNDTDYTERVRCLGRVMDKLDKKQPVTGELFAESRKALTEFEKIFQSNKKITGSINEFLTMHNFLDDQLMVSNVEYRNDIRQLINDIVKGFKTEFNEEPEHQKIGEILIKQRLVSEGQVEEALHKQKKLGKLLVEEGALSGKELQKAIDIQNKQVLNAHLRKGKGCEAIKTIRIDQHKLDNFANAVGELFINIDSISFIKKQIEKAEVDFDLVSRFGNAISSLDDKVEQLQESIMSIRRVPVKTLFQRFPRVVRQLSSSLDKDILFKTHGEDTVIDKDLLEKIENPLVHLLRNAVDHGIELPEARKAKGKPSQGCVELKAWADDNNIYIDLQDDGKGIDPKKMKEIAIKKDFMAEHEVNRLSDKELINLIFKPGFSSAEKISDVSGRGVGMDVVLSGLKDGNGTVDIDSTVDQGTRITIKIPLTKTLVTKDAMIVQCGDQDFVIPSDDITTVIDTRDTLIPILAEGNCISYDNTMLRAVNVRNFFYPRQETETKDKLEDKVAAICKDYKIALLVDQVLGHQKVVVKDFVKGSKKFKEIDGISGYTIMGNEDIVLIVDPQEIAKHASS